MWEQHCYDSVLVGKAVSEEDYRLAVGVMGWETLHTDVLGSDGELGAVLALELTFRAIM